MRRHRSPTMWLIAQILPKLQFPGMKDREDAIAYMQRRQAAGAEALSADIVNKCKSPVIRKDWQNMPTLYFGTATPDCPVVLYLHGGAYVYQLDPSQVAFCDKLALTRNALVIAPAYPLAPQSTFLEAYQQILGLYTDLTKTYPQGVTILGDSAGAGLAVGLTLMLKEQQLPLPRRLILCSPWVDVEMQSSDYSQLQKVDPMLNAEALRELVKHWANGADLRDYRLSPTFGPLEGLPPVDIHSGTREILYPDAILFYEKLLKAGVDATFTTGRKLTHDYIMIPAPEQNELISGFIL